jgi:hypothetical protein
MRCSIPSICIPRTFPNITEAIIRNKFDALDFGTIDRVDILTKEDDTGKKFNLIFIHFIEWNDTPQIMEARQRLLAGQQIKMVYDDPWFWKLTALRPKVKRNPVISMKRPTRVISAEMCGAYDFGPNGEMVPYVSPSNKLSQFVMKYERNTEQCFSELKELDPESCIPIDEKRECCFCQR